MMSLPVSRLSVPLLALSAFTALAGCSSSSSPAPGGAAGTPATPSHAAPAATVYFAESGSTRGRALVRPACGGAEGCLLSGDSTEAMFDMTWTTWNATEAVGHGTDKIDGCDPNCAAGKQYPVAVTVTLSQPVTVKCGPSGTRRYWTRASFAWPKGLPAALSGDGAPANPLVYDGLGGGTCG